MASTHVLVATLIVGTFLAVGAESIASDGAPRMPHTQASLLSEEAAIAPSSTFTVGVRLAPPEGWHTYWRNPGDSGMATSVVWHLPAGITVGPLQWPTPSRQPAGPLVNYGYDKDVVLLATVKAPADLTPGQSLTIRADASWLVCKDICVPESTSLSVDVGVEAKARTDTGVAPMFEAARALLPRHQAGEAHFSATADRFALKVPAAMLKVFPVEEAWFYPDGFGVLDYSAPQALKVGSSALSLTADRGGDADPKLTTVEGVLVVRAGDRHDAIDLRAVREP